VAGEFEQEYHFMNEQRLDNGPWQALERGVARLLQHGGFKDVTVVGGTGDLGADVVATKGKKKWVIQAKYRSSGNVGRTAVMEAFKAMQAYGADSCVTVTNQFFSPDAVKYNTSKRKLGYDTQLWDRTKLLSLGNTIPLESNAKKNPREYQKEAIHRIFLAIRSGQKSGLITLATGLGKTMVASNVIAEYLLEQPNAKILVLAHMSDLVRQLDAASWAQIDKTTHTHVWTDGERPAFNRGIIYATWQSIDIAEKNGEIPENYFDLIIVDECHHAPSIAFSELLLKLNASFLLGVTATPWRSDDSSLRNLFGDPLFSMNVVEGMQQGFLSRVNYQMLTDGINWENISLLSQKGHTVKDLNQLLYVPERDLGMVDEIVSTIKKTKDPRVLIFCRTIRHSERLLGFFRRYDIPAAILHSQLNRTERFKALSSFRLGKITVLISIEMLNEGIDIPEVNIVCFARVTHSRRIFLQQLGRGLRISDNKSEVKVLDFVADIRRVAAGLEINAEAARRREEEIVSYPEGNIVNFSNDVTPFFDQYLEDMADIGNLDDSSRLNFPELREGGSDG
tara:strand:- start:3105 stop:4799 length:1695 start_codon:yes stop_codon:yes gene_type:complete